MSSQRVVLFLSVFLAVSVWTICAQEKEIASDAAAGLRKGSTPLQELVNSAARATLAQFAARQLDSNELAFTVVDLLVTNLPVQASYRGEAQIYPASVVKLFYLVAVHQWMEKGQLHDTPELRRAMRDMMVDSSKIIPAVTRRVLDGLTAMGSRRK